MKHQPMTPEAFSLMVANLEKVRTHFPKAFPRQGEGEVLPLKEGIHKDLLAKSRELQLGMSWKQVRQLLGYWCSRPFYLRSFKKSKVRIDLDGNPAEELTTSHKDYAKERKQKIWGQNIPVDIRGLSPASE